MVCLALVSGCHGSAHQEKIAILHRRNLSDVGVCEVQEESGCIICVFMTTLQQEEVRYCGNRDLEQLEHGSTCGADTKGEEDECEEE